jgi:hypothetical protein
MMRKKNIFFCMVKCHTRICMVKVGESTYKICLHPFFFDFPYILLWDIELIIFFLNLLGQISMGEGVKVVFGKKWGPNKSNKSWS